MTIVFTDIVDSTVLISRLGDHDWPDLLRRHNSVIEDATAACGGTSSNPRATDRCLRSRPLAAEARAHEMFGRLISRQNRYAILYRVGTAKRAETRERRIKQFVEMLTQSKTFYPQERT